ncbi:hypothetical protein GCM10011331_05900 [Flavimobilis marinus]|uniref:WG containing repeat-containing protein n=1 Tax=Flavimobilis marinus TaxID=285351 RepID=A0A1I2D4T9_9MICO|nr:WG repeat-containing protein [Flavimobilis marinus]GHG46075.1 hypothetical protein GCM10011331_05900 [Flavimobilis marinus]SFE75521.1 WG containing repeat-containing protein [Flavimobilis marinus]
MASWYRYVVLSVLVALVGGGWVSLVRGNAADEAAYEQHLTDARAAAERGVNHEVIASYEAALALRPSRAVAWEVTEYLAENGTEAQRDEHLWAIATTYDDPQAYADLIEAAVAQDDFETAFEVVRAAEAAEVASDRLTAVTDAIAYEYELGSSGFASVTPFLGDVAAVDTGDGWRAVDAEGKGVGKTYAQVGPHVGGRIPVVDDEGTPFFIDGEGEPVLVATKVDYTSYGALGDGLIPARTRDGGVVYVDTSFVPALGGTRYADGTAFSGGIAAVFDGTTWSVIDTAGRAVVTGLASVVRDDRGALAAQGRFFATADGKVRLYTTEGSVVGEETFLAARAFVDGAAAVQTAAGWGFIATDGSWVVKPQFADARSYTHGLAPVKVGDAWGYVNSAGRIVVEPVFGDATMFASTGAALVRLADEPDRTEPRWVLLQLLRYKEN